MKKFVVCILFYIFFFNIAHARQFEEVPIGTPLEQLQHGASLGNISYQTALGSSLVFGYNNIQDCKAGIAYLDKARMSGYAPAIYTMSIIYNKGICVQKDMRNASFFLFQSAEAGYGPAQSDFSEYLLNDTSSEMAFAEAYYYAGRAAENGVYKALAMIGLRLLTGANYGKMIINKNIIKGESLLKEAANNNCMEAILLLGMKQKEDKNYYEAAENFKRAAEHGNAIAQSELGLLLIQGLGVIKDINLGKYWLQKAAEQGDGTAIKVLNQMNGQR